MYKITIKTKYGLSTYKVDEINTDETKQILNQEEAKEILIERLKQERDLALQHVVGTSFWNEVAQQKNEEIKLLKKSI